MSDRLYCTVSELLAEIEADGRRDEATLVRSIRRASDWVDRRLGQFIPVTETRSLDGTGEKDLWTDPLLAITTLTNDGDTITSGNYLLYPRARHWENGPYTRISVDPDATLLSYWVKERDGISIVGRWGLYEESIDTGATVQNTTQISANGTSLLVDDGSKVSPCMVLLIESEQLVITDTGAATDSTADLAEALDNSEEEVDVNDGTQVNVGEVLLVDYERMKVLAINGNTLVVVRGWGETKKDAHTSSTSVFVFRTFTVTRAANGTTAATHASGTAISRYIPPYDVGYLTLQIAALMGRKAQSGFAGKTGNPETGEIFYHNEFPRAVYQEVQRNYRIVRV